jgi:hypothetical protein
MVNKQQGEKMKTSGFIEGECSECKKVGPYNEMRAWSMKDYGMLITRTYREFVFCSLECAQEFERKMWIERFAE